LAKSFPKLLQSRRSATGFDTNSSLTLTDISTLLDVGYGLNHDRRNDEGIRRYVPSAGALFPLEMYLMLLRVEQIDAEKLFHYQPRTHELELIGSCEGQKKAESLLTQRAMADAAAILFVSGCMPRVTWKYGERGYRYILLEAGHVAQNICLAGAALNIGVCPVAGYYDDVVHDLFWLDGVTEFVVYVLCIGRT
jgi:SagB-type dehydrogenase family enzyme